MVRSPVTEEDDRRIGAAVDVVVSDSFRTVADRRPVSQANPSGAGRTPRGLRVVWCRASLWRSLGELHRMRLGEALAVHGLSESMTVHAFAMPGNRSNPLDQAVPTSGDHIGTEERAQAFVPRRSG